MITGTVQSIKCKDPVYGDTNRLETKNLQPKAAGFEALSTSERGGIRIEERASQDAQGGGNIEDTGL